MYDNTDLSVRAVSLTMLGIGTNFVFSLLSWLFYPKQNPKSKSYVTLSETELEDSAGNAIELSDNVTKKSPESGTELEDPAENSIELSNWDSISSQGSENVLDSEL